MKYLDEVLILLVISAIVIILHFIFVRRRQNRFNEIEYQTNEKYQNLVKLLPQTVFESQKDGRITFLNDFGFKFTAYNKFSLENGLSLFDLIVEKEHNILKETILYTLEGGLNKGQEFILRNANGKFIPVNIYFSSSDEAKNELKGIIIDATEKVKWENRVLGAILETEDKERKRFSEDLHDGLGPLLSTIKLYISQLRKGNMTEEENNNLLQYTEDLIEEAISNTKQISNNILPGAIDDNGLIPAINDFFERIRRISNITIIFRNNIEKNIPEHIEKTIFKIIYELINNTIKHSDSKLVKLDLNYIENNFELIYNDNGKGFDIDNVKLGLGLNNIQNRSKSLNADFNINSKPGKGMTFTLKLTT